MQGVIIIMTSMFQHLNYRDNILIIDTLKYISYVYCDLVLISQMFSSARTLGIILFSCFMETETGWVYYNLFYLPIITNSKQQKKNTLSHGLRKAPFATSLFQE